jgi:glycosyltransferase involved in cell wall biosynthesis
MRHIHILDPQLADQGGHYFNHDFQLLREILRRGLGASLYGRRAGRIDQCSEVSVTPAFANDIFLEKATDASVWPIENFHALNQAFLDDLLALDREAFSADDLVYFPNLIQNQVLAIARWLNRLPPAQRPAVALMFRYLNHAMDYVQARQNKDMIALYYRFAVKELRRAQPRTLICADTTELAKAYERITGGPVLELPNPMDVSGLLDAGNGRPGNQAPVVVYQGHTSPLRGFQFLPEIIERCSRLQPRPRFVVQLQNRNAAQSMNLGNAVARLDAFPAQWVTVVSGALSQAAYFDMLAGADIVLLPYTPTFYGCGSSGVFTEAASLGKVVVVSAGTVPARQGREYGLGVVAAEKWTAQAMADAVARALKELHVLRRQSEAGAPRFRQENCALAFWDKLLGAVGTLPALSP